MEPTPAFGHPSKGGEPKTDDDHGVPSTGGVREARGGFFLSGTASQSLHALAALGAEARIEGIAQGVAE